MGALFVILEFAAFTLPGTVAVAGYPWTCFFILVVYWLGHTMGATRQYKLFKQRKRNNANA